MKTALSCLLVLSLAPSLQAQERPWYTPRSRMLNLVGISGRVSDTMGLALLMEAPVATDSATHVNRLGRAFAAVAGVYASLKVATPVRDSGQMVLGNQNFVQRNDIGGRSLAMYLECGSDVNGLWAEIYRIRMTLVTFLTPSGVNDIEIRTVMMGTAIEIPRALPNTRECRSTGQLERRVYDMTVKALAKEGYRGLATP